ncbi:hypothetical protein D3H65_02590 [Paraflavitalea soli]|uniref:Lipocalin-like domain-containing protein n=1 Tax=Paraflavitalea soli TaxID=2315862 RepID=A0A3B7MF28_9BACT|nr:hypothetical protein [Paraflavitalea soli]AXY72922.1 hypothetical protein D3H65_02590 [Paraflavitalea soli]
MRIGLLAVLIGVVLTACKSKAAHEAIYGLPVTDQKLLKDMAGSWFATEETHALLAKKKYARDSVHIELRPDSSFKVRLPDCMDAAAKGGLVWEAIGGWRLHKNGDDWKLGMAFEKGRLFRYRTFTDFDIVIKDSVLTLSRYVGDPDEEEALQFRKAHP